MKRLGFKKIIFSILIKTSILTSVLIVAALLFGLVGAGPLTSCISPGSASAQVLRADFVDGEILVKFKPGTPGIAIADAHRQNSGQVIEVISRIDVQVVRVPVGQEKGRVAAYARNPNVLFAEPNGLYYAITHGTNDPKVSDQWQYNNIGQTGGTSDADIDAFEAWHTTTGSSTVAIAILDTGIDQSHEDLMSKIGKNKNFTSSRTVDDKYGHGTHVAGSAAAITDNNVGVAGTCPNCVLYNVKVLGDNGSGSWSGVANGIIWAADNGAKVISMSLGGGASSTVESAVNYAWNKGSVLTAAAGNSGTSDPLYPAFYTNVIAVAATDHTDQKPSWSNWGSWVDVAAPGVSILSTAPDHNNSIWGTGVKYGTISGTSMATPHVAGVAGLVFSVFPSYTNTQVRAKIESSADTIAGTGSFWAWGRINANAAVAVAPPAPAVNVALSTDKTNYVSGTDTTAILTAVVTDENKNAISGLTSVAFATTLDGVFVSVIFTETATAGTYTGNLDISLLGDGTHTAQLTVTDTRGLSGTASATFTKGPAPTEPTTVSVASITYATQGGKGNNRDLLITVALVDNLGNPVAGASVSITLKHDSGKSWSGTGTTGTNGKLTFILRNAPSGCYTTTVTNVSAGALTWDGVTPPNSGCK